MRIFFSIFIAAAVLYSEARVLKDMEEKNRVFTNMRAGLEASKDISNAIETVLEAMDAASSRGSGRHLASTKGNKKGKKSKKSKSSSCEKELQQCKAAAAEPKALFIQTGNECRIERDGENNYKLISDVGNETFLFLDRPRRFEDMVSTKAVIDDFGMLFDSSDPNIGVTLVSKDTEELLNPLVVIGSNPTITGDSVVYYDIEQSESQESVISLDSLFEAGMDSVSFKDCSFFIDNVQLDNVICCVDNNM